jgi:hypothetical protein
MKLLSLSLFVSLLSLPVLNAGPNSLTEAERAEGWILLFDGRSLDGWRGYHSEAIGEGWKAVDETLTFSGKESGDIMTISIFGDFELTFEWSISEEGNSGIIYRSQTGMKASYRTGPEYQVLDNIKAEDNKEGNHLAGSLYDVGDSVPRNATNPVETWNQGRIIVRDWKVEHWLNQERVVSIDLASAHGKSAIAASKFADWPEFARFATGHIVLQDHGHAVSFRSLKIRTLD